MCIVRTLSQFHTSFQVRSKNVYRPTFEFFDRKKTDAYLTKVRIDIFLVAQNITLINSVFIIFFAAHSVNPNSSADKKRFLFKRIAGGKKISGRTLHFESVKINTRLHLNIYLQSREFQCALVAICNLCYSKWKLCVKLNSVLNW